MMIADTDRTKCTVTALVSLLCWASCWSSERWFIVSGMSSKMRAVAAQTAWSRCKVLSIQYAYYFSLFGAYQRQLGL